MRVTLAGLPFDAVSPSHFRFAPELLEGHALDLSFLGRYDAPWDGQPPWCLFHETPQGDVSTQMFATRDEAIDYLAGALR